MINKRVKFCVINDNSKFDDYWLFENDFGNKRLILWKISNDPIDSIQASRFDDYSAIKCLILWKISDD